MAGKVMTSGSSWVARSMNDSTSSTPAKVKYRAKRASRTPLASVGSAATNFHQIAAASSAAQSSTTGWRAENGARQVRQRPRRRRYERIGMLSAARTGAPQPSQREAGRTTDSPRGTRSMQTLKKLPHRAPNTPASAVARGDERNPALSPMRVDAKVGGALQGNKVFSPAVLLTLALST